MNANTNNPAPLGEDLWALSLPLGPHVLRLMVGDLQMLVYNKNYEWQLYYDWHKQGQEGHFSAELLEPQQLPTADPSERIALDKLTDTIKLTPRLADRPLVVRPVSPITIVGHSRVTLYVSTPLWLQLRLSDRHNFELPVQQLSDTWMGGLGGDGVLCYGSRTHARLDPDILPRLPYRALTPVVLHNNSGDHCRLQRLSLPLPYLSVYQSDQGLITEPLEFSLDPEQDQSVAKIGTPAAGPRLSPARLNADKGILVSAWSNVFG